jgi:hypothetical protein
VSRPDHAALQNSDLNPFLYADVGKELNGSTLTMLSVLARLGEDPWAEAGRWAKLPKAAAVECLITTIAGFPLTPEAGSDPRAVAARLVLLLPAQEWLPDLQTPSLPTKTAVRALGASLGATALPRWLPMAVLACALLLGLAFNLLHMPGGSTVSPKITQTDPRAPAAPSH